MTSILLKHVYLNGADSILLFGTTGEGNSFSERLEEKSKLINFVLGNDVQKKPIISGIFQNNSNRIIDEIEMFGKKFKNLNFLLPSPLTEKLVEDDLKSFFINILDSINVDNKIILYNNPTLFAGNNISQNILTELIKYPNIIGIKDSSEKLGNYKGYIQNISENFSVCCGKERQFSQFLQLIPKEKRKYSALIPSISNVLNVCKKLYLAAVEEDPLKIAQYQEAINEFRDKIYDNQTKFGKQQRGLKYAFYSLYKDSLELSYNDTMNFSLEFQKPVEKFVLYRIDVTIHYLLNLNYIDKLYPVGNELFNFLELKEKFQVIEDIKDLGVIRRIKGPYDRNQKTSTIYRIKFDQDLILRFNDLKSSNETEICREKLLYPFLDGTLHAEIPELRNEIKKIISKVKGNYIFDAEKHPIIPVPNLIYFDESKQFFPCNYTIQEYIPGKPFYYYKKRFKMENFELEIPKLNIFFKNAGKTLAKIHGIKFNSFYEKVTEIGKETSKKSWFEIFDKEFEYILAEAKKNKINLNKEIKEYIKDNYTLIEEEYESIALHNDFHGQNIIIKDETSAIRINGFLNFENWRVGVRAMDFAPFEYLTLRIFRLSELNKAFYDGYEKYYKKPIDKEFLKKIELYKLVYFLNDLNRNPQNSGLKREINKILATN